MKTKIALLTVLLTGCHGVANTLGWHGDAARAHAEEWAQANGLEDGTIVCNSRDTDGDGYVSCSFKVGTDLRTYECAGWTLIVSHDGCREPKIRVPPLGAK